MKQHKCEGTGQCGYCNPNIEGSTGGSGVSHTQEDLGKDWEKEFLIECFYSNNGLDITGQQAQTVIKYFKNFLSTNTEMVKKEIIEKIEKMDWECYE